MTREQDLDNFISYLGEGFHTAFRKGTDAPQSAEIHRLIRQLDPRDWEGILRFTGEPLFEYAEELIRNSVLTELQVRLDESGARVDEHYPDVRRIISEMRKP